MYRSDVDGLRAIAVLAVVGFHAFPKYVPGGLVGVDVFFVISGFLISGLIYRALRDGTFSLADFYARRIRPIFPALIAVLAACLAVGWLVLFDDEYRALGKEVAAGAGFVANFLYLSEVGYFDKAAELKPLLHLWSLAIEEQFYIIWPLLILVCWRARINLLAVAAAVFAASFAWNVILTASNPPAAFYLPFTRFWELMLGGLLAFAMLNGKPRDAGDRSPAGWFERLAIRDRVWLPDAAAGVGIALIALSIAIVDRTRFPGWWALLPTAGTMLVIAAGQAAWINREVLSRPQLVYIGLISYPLYLWHWPILAFERILWVKEPSVLMKLGGVAAAFLLAAWTYRFIERPVRFGTARVPKLVGASLALAVLGSLGVLILANGGFGGRFPGVATTATVMKVRSEALAAYRQGECFLGSGEEFVPQCDGNDRSDVRPLVLWGDSHAAHIFPGLKALEHRDRGLSVAQYSVSGCPPILSFSSVARRNCQPANERVSRKIVLRKPETVIMAARWDRYQNDTAAGHVADDQIRATVDWLKSAGVRRVIGVGQFPLWHAAPAKIQARLHRYIWVGAFAGAADKPPERDKTYLDGTTFRVDQRLKRVFEAAGTTFISPPASLCNAEGCLLVVPGGHGEFMSWDHSHLTKAGSIFFADANAGAILGR